MSRVYNHEELASLIDDICAQISNELIKANMSGTIDKVLKKYEYNTIECGFYEPRYAKILVLGQSMVSQDDLNKILKKHSIKRDRVEFVLGYYEAQCYPMDTLRNNMKYCDIFIGPIPHCTNGMGDCNSIISKIENNQSEYPKLTRLMSSGELKITKNSFEEALLQSELFKNCLNV